MRLKRQEVILKGADGDIRVKRNQHGIPEISAASHRDLACGLGWVHGNDRQLQVLLTRILLQGKAAEVLAGEPALVEIDRFMRRMNFLPDAEKQIKRLEPPVKEQLAAYADGFNRFLEEHGPVWEFRLLGHRPERWEIKDSLVIGKIFGYLGLADVQGTMEKLLVQMIQNDIDDGKIREIFPYLTDRIDRELLKKITLSPPIVPATARWLSALPRFIASNNWVVSGRLTESGKPMLCNDPHLEVNRLPSVWMETVMRLPDNVLVGAGIPGVPGLALGRTRHLAWGATHAFMDMIDFRIEHCKNGKYRRGNKWEPFRVREEVIRVKKGQSITETIYENELGLLEGEPNAEGHRLVMCWSAARDCVAGEFNALLNLASAKTVREGMEQLRKMDSSGFNWVLADARGNIGYQMSGRFFNRPRGTSGLLPVPAWDKRYNWKGYVKKTLLPALYNPRDGIIVTANQDLNHLGKSRPINLCMAGYRAERILQLLMRKKKLKVEHMKRMHFDLYSLQAQRFMKVIKPLLPRTENGRILKEWDFTYRPDSRGAMLFESVYMALIRVVFGDNGLGRDTVEHLMKETSLLNDFYGNFDAILLKKKSAWFQDRPQDELFRKAIEEGLRVKAVPYGKTRRIMLSHLLFGGKLPGLMGFDFGPIELPGGRATIPQGQIFKTAGRVTSFSPSYRMIIDMAAGEIHTTLAGGPSDRRFSPWYVNDVINWMKGAYKVLR